MKNDINNVLIKKKIFYKKSESSRIVDEFDKSKSSKILWKFLCKHRSCRVVFNALIKSGLVELEEARNKLPNLLQLSRTSFIFLCKCKNCQQMLDRPNIANIGYKIPNKKEISCPKCSTKNIFTSKDYEPLFTLESKDLIKFIHEGHKTNLFSPSYNLECFTCGHIETLEEKGDVRCKKCKSLKFIFTSYLPSSEAVKKLSSNKQGYWLEWYVLKMLDKKFQCIHGAEIQIKPKVEIDIIVYTNKKLIAVECKDSNDTEFIEKLDYIKKMFDYLFLVSTNKFSEAHLEKIRTVLGEKFILVQPHEIESVADKIHALPK